MPTQQSAVGFVCPSLEDETCATIAPTTYKRDRADSESLKYVLCRGAINYSQDKATYRSVD